MDLDIIKSVMKLIPEDDELEKKDNDGLKDIIHKIKDMLGPLLTADNIKKGASFLSKFMKK